MSDNTNQMQEALVGIMQHWAAPAFSDSQRLIGFIQKHTFTSDGKIGYFQYIQSLIGHESLQSSVQKWQLQ